MYGETEWTKEQEEFYRMFRAAYAAPGDEDFEEFFGKEIADLYRDDLATLREPKRS